MMENRKLYFDDSEPFASVKCPSGDRCPAFTYAKELDIKYVVVIQDDCKHNFFEESLYCNPKKLIKNICDKCQHKSR